MNVEQSDEYRLNERANRWRVRAGALAFLLLIAFVGVVPTFLEVRHMPAVHKGDETRGIRITAWPPWPERMSLVGAPEASADLQRTYTQVAIFANRTEQPMAVLERTISHFRQGAATRNDLLETARAAEAAASDEEDALMGLVLPPSLRSNAAFNQGWEQSQLAAIAKKSAFERLEAATTAHEPLQAPEYRQYVAGLRTVREKTEQALNSMRRSAG